MKLDDLLEWPQQEYPYMNGNGELDMMWKDQDFFWPKTTRKKKKKSKKRKSKKSSDVL